MRQAFLLGSAISLAGFPIIFSWSVVTKAAQQEPLMKVLIYEGKDVILRADGNNQMKVSGLSLRNKKLRKLKLTLRGDLIEAKFENKKLIFKNNLSVLVSNSDKRGIWLGDRRYRGVLNIGYNSSNLQVINRIGVETYLASVVGSEMPHSWPFAALQAQAIAARTYALRKLKEGSYWDIKSTVSNQVYRGIESETPVTRKAVASTRSLVILHQGKLINAVFHSSSGGFTEESGNVWSKQYPYLVSVKDYDQQSPSHRWQILIDSHFLRNRIPETGGITTIKVLNRSKSGRVQRVKVKGPIGTTIFDGKDIRDRLNLKSTSVEFEIIGRKHRFRHFSNFKVKHNKKNSYKIPNLPPITFANLIKADQIFSPPPLPPVFLNTQPLSIRKNQNLAGLRLLVSGRGHGHGVGMSQWGAYGMADQGANFREIISHFYKGVDVRPFYPFQAQSIAKSSR